MTAVSHADRLTSRARRAQEWGTPDPTAGARARQAQREEDDRILALAAEEADLAEAKLAEKVAYVTEHLPPAIEEYERAREVYTEAIEAAARATMACNAARVTYTDLWSKTLAVGQPVPVRLAPVALGDAIRTINAYGPGAC